MPKQPREQALRDALSRELAKLEKRQSLLSARISAWDGRIESLTAENSVLAGKGARLRAALIALDSGADGTVSKGPSFSLPHAVSTPVKAEAVQEPYTRRELAREDLSKMSPEEIAWHMQHNYSNYRKAILAPSSLASAQTNDT